MKTFTMKELRTLRIVAAQEICKHGYSANDAIEVLGIQDHVTIAELTAWYKEVETSGSFATA